MEDSQKVAYVAHVIPVNEATNHVMLTAKLLLGRFLQQAVHGNHEIVRVPDDRNVCAELFRNFGNSGDKRTRDEDFESLDEKRGKNDMPFHGRSAPADTIEQGEK